MELLVQYLDDIEDLFYAIALKAERIRMALQFLLSMAIGAALQVTGVIIALQHPPVALAMASLLMVGMLYHAAVGNSYNAFAS